ncbi:MAG TPA: hypothetical protein V6C97_18805 [Oculatellaceae cyanobacterium]
MKTTPLNAFLAGVMSISLVLPAVAQTFNGRQLQGSVTYVPIGTTLDASLTSPIDSAVGKAGDMFNARLNAPLYMGSDLVLPAGTSLEGNVTSSDKSGHLGSNGIVSLHLTGAVTPDGIRYPLSANVTTSQAKDPNIHEDKQGNLKGRTGSSTLKSGVVRTALWTGGGTLLGICFAPIVGGAVGAGAIAGVATGGAVGLGSNLWRKGKDVRIPSGTRIQFALDQPMAVSASVASLPNSSPNTLMH